MTSINTISTVFSDEYTEDTKLEELARHIDAFIMQGVTVRSVDNSGGGYIINNKIASDEISKWILELIEDGKKLDSL